MTSSIPAVKAALHALLTETLTSTEVVYGAPSSLTVLPPRCCFVGKVKGRRELESMGLASVAEFYEVEIIGSVSLAGTNQQLAYDTVLADFEAGEAAIRGHAQGPTLGLGDGIHCMPTGEFELTEVADQAGRHAAIRWPVQVRAQAT